MDKSRLEAFSDGVIAIILTIMVLDLKVPKEHTFEALTLAWPVFAAYALSYWNIFLLWLNHHDIFARLEEIDRHVLVANGLLLFLASFIPFATAFASDAHWTQPVPVVLYGLLMAGVSLSFARLRQVALNCLAEAALRPRLADELRSSLFMALAFLVGAAVTWFAPRWGLVLYALAPAYRLIKRSSRNRDADNGA